MEVARLFHVAVAREDLRAAKARGVGFWSTLSDEAIESMGVAAEVVTHVFDVRPYVEEKLLAIQMHASQIPFRPKPGSPGDPAMRPRMGKESLTRIPLPWDVDDRDFLDDLHTDEAIPL